MNQVVKHPWFKDFDWESLLNQSMKPLYLPSKDVNDNYDKNNVN